MILTRRGVLGAGGAFAVGLMARQALGQGSAPVEIRMLGNADGSRVGYDPAGLHVAPATTIRWINADSGNAHTATAYHPDIMDRPRRIPEGAEPWDSEYLLPDESFSVTLTVPGVYDFYCVPHEHAGMVGRIVVGEPGEAWRGYAAETDGAMPVPDIALIAIPAVADIVRLRTVPGTGG
jgi:plastocyanin